MGVIKFVAKQAGRFARWRRKESAHLPVQYERKGAKMGRLPKDNTGTGFKPRTTARKNRLGLSLTVFNGGVGFLRGFKPEWLWPPEQDGEMLIAINGLIAAGHAAWGIFWNVKANWFDKLKR